MDLVQLSLVAPRFGAADGRTDQRPSGYESREKTTLGEKIVVLVAAFLPAEAGFSKDLSLCRAQAMALKMEEANEGWR
ncbi:MAG: hypothetical protein LBI81_02955 [Puniceicoccales bacterium]|nr:hypothetical protein [Puniceicoccales bacterium]